MIRNMATYSDLNFKNSEYLETWIKYQDALNDKEIGPKTVFDNAKMKDDRSGAQRPKKKKTARTVRTIHTVRTRGHR